MIAMLTLLACADSRAFAEPDVDVSGVQACSMLGIERSLPATDATNVPIDASMLLVFDGDCGGATDWVFEISESDGTVVATMDWRWNGVVPALVTFDPAEDLPANTALTLSAAAVEYYYGTPSIEVPFTTGEGLLQPITGAPTLEITEATWFRRTEVAEVSVVATSANDPNGLSLLRFTGEQDTTVYIDADDADFLEPLLSWFQSREPTELCITVEQLDANGVVGSPVEACAPAVIDEGEDLENDRRGCGFGNNEVPVSRGESTPDQAPPPPQSSLVVLAGLGWLLRRSPR